MLWDWLYYLQILNCQVIKRNNYQSSVVTQPVKFQIDWCVYICTHSWPLYTGKPIWRGAFIVAADRLRLGPLYTEVHYIVKNVGRARNWPLWAGDLYTEVTVKAGLTVIHVSLKCWNNTNWVTFIVNLYFVTRIIDIRNKSSLIKLLATGAIMCEMCTRVPSFNKAERWIFKFDC